MQRAAPRLVQLHMPASFVRRRGQSLCLYAPADLLGTPAVLQVGFYEGNHPRRHPDGFRLGLQAFPRLALCLLVLCW